MSEFKTYVLLEDTRPNAPIYDVVGDKKIQRNTLPSWRPNLQFTYADENGKNVTSRLKLNSNSIYQDVQVKEENIPANAKFTTAERNITKFKQGVLVVKNKVVQDFLEEGCPQFEGFKGTPPQYIKPMFEKYEKEVEIKNQNKLTRKAVKAANKILEMSLRDTKEMLVLVYGVGYVPSNELEENQNTLIEYMDTGEEAVDEILKKTLSADDKVKTMIGVLVAEGVVSFDAVPDTVSKKHGNEWQLIREISSNEYEYEQRVELLCDFLLSSEGKALKENLEEEARKLKK